MKIIRNSLLALTICIFLIGVSLTHCTSDKSVSEIVTERSHIGPEKTDEELLEDVRIQAEFFNDEETPENCQPRDATLQMAKLFDAINRGDIDTALSYFGEEPDYPFVFSWGEEYNSDSGVAFRQDDRDKLEEFLYERIQQSENIVMTEIMVNWYTERTGLTHYGPIYAYRTANDFSGRKYVWGKGTLYCQAQTFGNFGLTPTHDQGAR